jgi:hypothetical protein
MPNIIHHASRLLSPDAPNAALARALDIPKATARSYNIGTRRPSVAALRKLQEALQEHARECWALAGQGGDLDMLIWQRAQEPKPAAQGCCSP